MRSVAAYSSIMRALFCFLLLVAAVLAEKKSYRGYQLLRVHPKTPADVNGLRRLSENVNLDFWSEPATGRNTDINVAPSELRNTKKTLRKLGLTYEIIQPDVQKLLDSTKTEATGFMDSIMNALRRRGISHRNLAKIVTGQSSGPQWLRTAIEQVKAELSIVEGMQFGELPQSYFNVVNRFAMNEEIEDWLMEVAATFPDLAEVESIGQTYEGRNQILIKIGANSRGQEKPIIWIDSGIHAREWLTVGTTVWIINMMLTRYNTDSEVKRMLDEYDWYILPVANPDGYEYTHTNDRLWRKTRSRNDRSSCRGTDPNRNWAYKWMVSGTSTSPCSSTYGGPFAASEKCVQNMQNKIMSIAPKVSLYMGVHSYSQMWLTPWAWGGNKPSDYSQLLEVANAGNAALRSVHGTRFVVGTPPDILYSASGGAYDWAKAVAGIKYTYTYELRPDSNAYNGFVVSENEIEPSGEEVWASLVATVDTIKAM